MWIRSRRRANIEGVVDPNKSMALNRSRIEALASEYAETEPLYTVEAEGIETLPRAFSTGEYGWRDAVWVVRWFCRRSCNSGDGTARSAAETEFENNEMDAVRDAIEQALRARSVDDAVDGLSSLIGVDVPVASAFLFYIDPSEYIVVGENEWTALLEAGELTEPYPDPPDATDYGRYLGTCRELSERYGCDHWSLYRALWRSAGTE